MIKQITWSRLKPYENYKFKSFEQLCYQIAQGLYEKQGNLTPIDDSGGGDGVEFYLTLPNGDQWGWQAKFYHPDKRLGDERKGRKRSIRKSLKRSCQVHPRLKKWFLCTPTNFTPGEQSWFKEDLPKVIPDDMKVELVHWSESDFVSWLRQPKFSGMRSFFFGELELSLGWFKIQIENQIAVIKDKFSPFLHIETQVDQRIYGLTAEEIFISNLSKKIYDFLNQVDENNLINGINHPIFDLFEWDKKSEIDLVAQKIQEILQKNVKNIQTISSLLNDRQIKEAQAFEISFNSDLLERFFENLQELFAVDFAALEYRGEKETMEETIKKATKTQSSVINNLLSVFSLLFEIKIEFNLIKISELHIFGLAGTGKTHIVSHFCTKRINSGAPAILLLGDYFTSSLPLRTQILRNLNIPANYSWNDFLQSLSTAAEIYQTRIPIVIDGLNQATDNGIFSKIWERELQGLIREISKTRNIVLITTCRSSYVGTIWGEIKLDNFKFIQIEGFKNNVKEAIQKYFDYYKIKAGVRPIPLYLFKHPIYLKIFCESTNPSREKETYGYVGDQTVYKIFEKFLKSRNTIICDRLGLKYNTQLLGPKLDKIASYLWENHCRGIPEERLINITDGIPREDLKWESSKAKAILDEGLLVFREMGDKGEVVYFTYDTLGGLLIAKHLIQKHLDHIEDFIQSEKTNALLFGADFVKLHPLYEDIRRSLATLLPIKTNKYLHNILNKPPAIDLSIRAIFEIDPDAISQDCINFITKHFETLETCELFFELARYTITHIYHPLNAKFWPKKLKLFSMPERDTTWTEYMRKNDEYFNKLLDQLEEICKNPQELSEINEKRIHLLAEYVMWMLTSTIRTFRDKATRALYYYGRRFPKRFLDLVLYSLSINDFYIPERMLAAMYGVMMARQYEFDDSSFTDEIMPKIARKLFNAIFEKDTPYSTTHILARDYAKYSIDIALMHHPNLLATEEQQRIIPPFSEGGIREWGESEDRGEGAYRDGNAPIHMDFRNYTLDSLVKDRDNYDFNHPQYKLVKKNIFWRLYQLGYSLDLFGEIDKEIVQSNYYSDGKIDRYGKKYSWIAFYELAGFRQDQGLLDNFYEDKVRISDADLDPSFPLDLQECNLVQADFLGDKELPVEDWILNGDTPDVNSYLIIDEICDELGGWVLLDGIINQEDLEIKRCCFIFLRGYIVNKADAELIRDRLNNNNFSRRLANIPKDYYTYAGEVPWCITYPLNMEDETVIYLGMNEEFKGLIPIRWNTWEGYAVNLGSNARTLVKQIAEHFDLCGQPQTFDLFEETGKKATMTFRYGEEFGDHQEFIYIRKDLIKRYLKTIKKELIWVVWGGREFKSEDITERDSFAEENEYIKRFQYVRIFRNIKNS